MKTELATMDKKFMNYDDGTWNANKSDLHMLNLIDIIGY